MLDPNQLKELNILSPWKTITNIGLIWVTIGASLYLCGESLWFLPVALPIIASRLLNDFISNFFCSFPLMPSTEVYRKTHWKHH